LDGAIATADQAREELRRVFGEEHPQIATALNNKALALKLRGDTGAAEPVYREVLEMRRKVLPPDHAEVAQSLNNLASLLRDTERHGEAEPLYREGLAIVEKSLPPGHFMIALCHRNLGNCLMRLGRFSEAEVEIQTAYDALTNTPGLDPNHVRATVEAFVKLYDHWAKSDPEAGADQKAAEWRARLPPSASTPSKP
jgi:tetratricopeptide (TPR) repeat protein